MRILISLLAFVLAVGTACPCEAVRVLRLEEAFNPEAVAEQTQWTIWLRAHVRFDNQFEHVDNSVEIRCWRLPLVVTVPDNAEPPVTITAKPVQSNQIADSVEGIYVAKQVARATTFDIAIHVDNLKLDAGSHRLMFEARATDATGRVSRAVAKPIDLTVNQTATVTGEHIEEKTVYKTVFEEKTELYTLQGPDGQTEQKTRTYTVAVRVPEVIAVRVSDIDAGQYSRQMVVRTSLIDIENDETDPNVTSELERIAKVHGVDRERTRIVYYATNREVRNSSANGVERFGNRLGSRMSYGSSLVRIPPTHFYGEEIDTPSWYEFDDPNDHFRVETLTGLRQSEFFTIMHQRLAADQSEDHRTKNDVLLYVHGFNTSMKFALLRLAQVTYDIGFEGAACAFVWPSNGSLLRYSSDLEDATASIDELATLIQTLCRAQDGGRVHIVAHSMGNYLTLQALESVETQWRNQPELERPQLGHVVLAAPDVWIEDFIRWTPPAIRSATSVTLYHCKDDVPLKISIGKHDGKPRAGLVSVPLSGLDNINCDDVNTTFLGHSAYADESPLLFDLQLLLQRDAPPETRPLERLHEPMPSYWLWKARANLAPVISATITPSP